MARVIYVGRTSLVVRVHVYGEHPFRGERRLCTTGYFSMVSIGPDNRPIAVPQLLLDDEVAREEWPVGEQIHAAILERRSRR
jgi:acyl-CoA hydrolase